MKKVTLLFAVVSILTITLSSCHKKGCPAYSKANTTTVEKA